MSMRVYVCMKECVVLLCRFLIPCSRVIDILYFLFLRGLTLFCANAIRLVRVPSSMLLMSISISDCSSVRACGQSLWMNETMWPVKVYTYERTN